MKNDQRHVSAPASRTAAAKGNDDGEFVTLAKVTKTQGRKGEVAAALLTDFPEKFATRTELLALGSAGKRRELALEEYWFHKGMVVLKFAGVDSISQAEELIGSEIQVPGSQRVELEDGAMYVSDLQGCTVYSAGSAIGKIADVQFGSGEAPLLVIKGTREFLVPLATEFIEKIALSEKSLYMKLPPGLLDLDAPLSAEEKQRQQQQQRD